MAIDGTRFRRVAVRHKSGKSAGANGLLPFFPSGQELGKQSTKGNKCVNGNYRALAQWAGTAALALTPLQAAAGISLASIPVISIAQRAPVSGANALILTGTFLPTQARDLVGSPSVF